MKEITHRKTRIDEKNSAEANCKANCNVIFCTYTTIKYFLNLTNGSQSRFVIKSCVGIVFQTCEELDLGNMLTAQYRE